MRTYYFLTCFLCLAALTYGAAALAALAQLGRSGPGNQDWSQR